MDVEDQSETMLLCYLNSIGYYLWFAMLGNIPKTGMQQKMLNWIYKIIDWMFWFVFV